MSLILKSRGICRQPAWHRWDDLTRKPLEIQEQLLLDIVQRNRATCFGRDHRFDAIRNFDDYRKQVEIGDYERLRPYVERIKNGAAGELTEEPVSMFTMTSGSTGEPKLIPVTATTRRNHREVTRLWYYRAYLHHPRLHERQVPRHRQPGHRGPNSRRHPLRRCFRPHLQSSPRWIQNAYAVPYGIAQVKDFAAKYYLIMRLGLGHDITFFATPNPSTIVKLVETADRCKEEIIRDIRDGTIAARWDVPARNP